MILKKLFGIETKKDILKDIKSSLSDKKDVDNGNIQEEVKGFNNLKDSINNAKKSYEDIINAQKNLNQATSKLNEIDKFNGFAKVMGSDLNSDQIKAYQTALNGLTDSQKIAILENNKFSASQIQQITGITTTAKAVEDLSNMYKQLDGVQNVLGYSLTDEDITKFQSYLNLMNDLTDEEKVQLLQKSGLNEKQIAQVLGIEATTVATAEETIAIKAETVATGEQMVADKAETVSLSARWAATKGFIATLWAGLPALTKFTIGAGAVIAVGYGLYKAFDLATTSAKEVGESVNSLLDNYNEAKNTLDSHKSTIDNISDRYEELSEGVNNLGENISLSTDEYKEYQDICNQIADMYPKLVTGYDEQGNAILNLKGNVEALTQAYKDEQKAAYNTLIATGEDDNGDSIVTEYKQLSNPSLFDKTFDFGKADAGGRVSNEEAKKVLKEVLSSNYDNLFRGDNGFKFTRDEMSYLSNLGLDIDSTEKEFEELRDKLESELDRLNADTQQKLSNMHLLANAYLMTNDDYNKLSEETQNAASIIVNNFNEDIANGFEDQLDVGAYVNNLVDTIKNNTECQEALANLFKLDYSNMPVDEAVNTINQYLNTLSKYLDTDDIKIIKSNLGLTDILDSSQKMQNSINNIAFSGGKSNKTISDISNIKIDQQAIDDQKKLKDATKDFTSAQVEAWLEATKGAKSADEAIQMYKQSLQDTEKTSLSFTDAISEIQSLSKGLDQLDSIYADVYDGEDFDWSSILNNDDFKNTFGNMENVSDDFKKSYEDFIQTVSNSPNDINACQDAFDRLATAYIYNSGALDDLTDDTKEATIAMLEQMGIANATEMVEARLAAQKEFLTLKGKNLADATWEEISSIVAEGNASETTTNYLANLALAKFDVNANSIKTDADVANIIAIANAAGTSTSYVNALKTALSNLQNAKANTTKVKTRNLTNGMLGNKEVIGAQIEEGMAQIDVNKAIEDVKTNIQKTQLNASDFYAHYTGGSATNSARDKANSGSDNSKEQEDTIENLDWIETLISRIERSITNLGKTVSATYKNWSTRNGALAQELAEVNNEIGVQQQAYNRYMAQANATGLSDYYKNLVMNGTIDVQTIQDDALKGQIDDFKEWYEKALDCADAIQDLQDKVAELAQTRFDLLSSEFDSKISQIEHQVDMLEGYANQTETAGYVASAKYYEALINQERVNMQSLQNEYATLTSAFNDAVNSGAIERDSEQWYDMKNSINDVEKALLDANTALVEYQNSMRQVSWDLFDKTEEYISKLTSESDFLIDLLDNKDLFDDNGNFTNEGLATQGLHAVNYNTYMQQANDYAKELLSINQQLANDPYNVDLIDRRNELLELQQEAISNAESEKDAIKDLISEGYDKMLEALQDLIDKRKEALQAEKDLYDYQKQISEQTKTIAEYQKQLQAYEGDDSEEAKAKKQQIKTNLEEAQQDLQDTEYDKWLSDQEAMLDNLYD